MILNEETLHQLRKLSECKATEWIGILQEIGEDPKTFFENGIWRNVDFSMSDMRGVSFRGSIVDRCVFRAGDVSLDVEGQALFFSRSTSESHIAELELNVDRAPKEHFIADMDTHPIHSFSNQLLLVKRNLDAGAVSNVSSLVRLMGNITFLAERIAALSAYLETLPLRPSLDLLSAVVQEKNLHVTYDAVLEHCSSNPNHATAGMMVLVSHMNSLDEVVSLLEKVPFRRAAEPRRVQYQIGRLVNSIADLNTIMRLFTNFQIETQAAVAIWLLEKKELSAKRLSILKVLNRQSVIFDREIFSKVLGRRSSWQESVRICLRICDSEIGPNANLFAALAGKVGTRTQGQELLDLMHERGIAVNRYIFVAMLNSPLLEMNEKAFLNLMSSSGVNCEFDFLNRLKIRVSRLKN